MKISSLVLFAGVVSAGCPPHSKCSSVTKVYTSKYTHLQTHTDAKTDVKTKTNVKVHTNIEKYTCVETNTGVRKYTSVQTACTSKPGKPADHTCACHTKGPKTSCFKWTTKPIPVTSCTTPTPKPKCPTKGPCRGTTTMVRPTSKPVCPTKGSCNGTTTMVRPTSKPVCSTKGPCHGTTTMVRPTSRPVCPTSKGKGPCSSVKPVSPKPSVSTSCSSKVHSIPGGNKGDNPKPVTKVPSPAPQATTPAIPAKPTPDTAKPNRPSNGNYTNPKTPEQFQGGSVQVNGWNSALFSVISVIGFFAFLLM